MKGAQDDQASKTAQRRDVLLLKLLHTPPQPRPHRERAGKKKRKAPGTTKKPPGAAT